MGGTSASGNWRRIALPQADVALWPHWLDTGEADALFAVLLHAVAWENHRIRLFGRELDSPRLSCWIGDPGAAYTYSRTRFEPRPWPAALAALRGRIEQACAARFNSVLANLYRDGHDAMGWHSDDEPELGVRPVIASLSLGAERRFRFRRRRARKEPALRAPGRTHRAHGPAIDPRRAHAHEEPPVEAGVVRDERAVAGVGVERHGS